MPVAGNQNNEPSEEVVGGKGMNRNRKGSILSDYQHFTLNAFTFVSFSSTLSAICIRVYTLQIRKVQRLS